MKTNMDASFPTAIYCDLSPIDTDSGIVYAAIVLLGLYVLIVLEVSCAAYRLCMKLKLNTGAFIRK
jgi:hypothetical protein